MWAKEPASALGDFEQLVLFGVLRLGDNAYGAAVSKHVWRRSEPMSPAPRRVASLGPAYRASRLDPLTVLRAD